MFQRQKYLTPPADRGPLRVMFIPTEMSVGGAETLLFNLIRRLNRERILPELCCLKEFGVLGQQLASEIPAFENVLRGKFDLGVVRRLGRLLRERRIDAVVTVGTGGDRMFWGRLAAWTAGVPVIVSALHATGLPDRVEWPNRRLARLTDAFIALADTHAAYLRDQEGCPAEKIRVIHNGIDAERFQPRAADPALRRELGLRGEGPVVAIVAQLRPEKNHELFLDAAALVHAQLPTAEFLIIGEGPRRAALEALAAQLGLAEAAHFCGRRGDMPEVLSQTDVVVLSSKMEASPVSILEALACQRPVVATRVGSVPELIDDGTTGYLVPPGNAGAMAERIIALAKNADLRQRMGTAGREMVLGGYSLDQMTRGYEDLIADIYTSKCRPTSLVQATSAEDEAALGDKDRRQPPEPITR